MLPPAALHAFDRLITALMTLIHAVAPSAPTQSLAEAAAQSLFFRLGQLVTHLIRISNFGTKARAKPTTPTNHPAPAPTRRPAQPGTGSTLPRRPGWLLAALPDIAPAVAADIGALLADPAFAALLDRAPSLHRTLRPLLRSLGLQAAAPRPNAASPPPARKSPLRLARARATRQCQPPPQNAPEPTKRLLTPNSLRYRNNLIQQHA